MTGKKKITRALAAAALIIIALLIVFNIIANRIEKNFEALSDMPLEDIDIKDIDDGIYKGSYKAFPVAAEVEVRIREGVITDIKITKHRQGQGKDAEAVIDKVISEQTLDVDTISGATYSSIVILKAVENALLQE